MPLESGQTLLHYQLIEKIGEGGMGVVWKAVDTTLDREVAIKVLPEALAGDRERLVRFEREAKLLATLNHPNIATVHGLHEAPAADSGSVRFLAMELAAGEDLAQRLSRGSMAVDEALRIGLQITEALEAAHESGVIHRDLKPGNIQLAPDGQIKVLDFGLAKAFEGDPDATSDPSLSPTVTSTGTVAGVILGTASYMSPEQAKGRPVDKRADIWAFGCVLYQMLTGRMAFHGSTVTETLASVLKDEPRHDLLPSDTPHGIRRLIRLCLQKDSRQRTRDIGDARIAVAAALAGDDDIDTGEAATSPPSFAHLGALAGWSLVAVLAAALAWSLWTRSASTDATATAVHLSMMLGEAEQISFAHHDLEVMPALALSPSGDRVVYANVKPSTQTSRLEDSRELRVRKLDATESEPVRGTEGAEQPFISFDGRWIGFFVGGELFKVPVGGGARISLVSAGPATGASWGEDDLIVVSHSYRGPLWTLPAAGGELTALTTLRDDENSHRYPFHLPDGKSVLFTIKPKGILSFDDGRIAVADLATGEHRILVEGGSYAQYAPSGHIVYARDGGLLAAPFDLDTLTITGGAVPVLDGLITNPVTGAALFGCAPDGTLVYVPGDYRTGPTRLIEIERRTGLRRPLSNAAYVALPRLSPDGRRIVMHGSFANDQVIVFDMEREIFTRLTKPTANNILPMWAPGGDRIVYTTDASGGEAIVWMDAGGGPAETLVEANDLPQDATSWSPDGKLLAFNRGIRSVRDIWVLDVGAGGKPEPFIEAPHYAGDAVFSPDGRWLAYNSDETGRAEIYASPYPGPGGRVQLSTGGGSFPRWRDDGRELYYHTETEMKAVAVDWNPGPRPGKPETLFEVTGRYSMGYDVTGDGERFFVVELDESRWRADRIDVVLNWSDELRRVSDGD